MSKTNNANSNVKCKHEKIYKTKLKTEEKRTRTIAFRVTENEYNAYNNNKEMKKLIIKYTRACLKCISNIK